MDSEEYVIDTVKFEKMNAMAKYNRFRKIMKVLQVLELLVALTLISWSSTYLPQVLKISGKFLFGFADYVFKPHVVFLIGNAIIVALVVLCRKNDASNNLNSGSEDLYDDYVRHSHAQQHRQVDSVPDADKSSPTSPATEKMSIAEGTDTEEKQIVYVSPVEEKPKQKEEEKEKEEEEEEEKLPEKEEEEKSAAVVTAIEDARKEIQRFQRTQSARLKRETTEMPRLELRRSATCRRSAATSFESVDSLSMEEFNLTVAAFIKRGHQEFLQQQKLADTEEF